MPTLVAAALDHTLTILLGALIGDAGFSIGLATGQRNTGRVSSVPTVTIVTLFKADRILADFSILTMLMNRAGRFSAGHG